MATKKKYIAMVETHRANQREQFAESIHGHGLSSSGRWTDAKLHDRKSEALAVAEEIARGFNEDENAKAFVRTVELDVPARSREHKKAAKPVAQRSQKSRSTTEANDQSQRKAAKSALSQKRADGKPTNVIKSANERKKATTYTIMGKTFATKAEAKAYKALQKQRADKPCEIKEGTRKPSHKVVSFTAKKK